MAITSSWEEAEALIAKKFTALPKNRSMAAWWSPRVGEEVIEHPICLIPYKKLINTDEAGNEYVRCF